MIAISKNIQPAFLIANFLQFDDTKDGFNIKHLSLIQDYIIKNHSYKGYWYFDITDTTIKECAYLYNNIWDYYPMCSHIFKKNDFNLQYFNKNYDDELISIVRKYCREVMDNNIIPTKRL